MHQDDMLGETLIVELAGQKVAGQVTAVHDTWLEVTLPIRQPAKGLKGTIASTMLPNGAEVSFDLGRVSHYESLVVAVPYVLPEEEEYVDQPSSGERRRFYRLSTSIDVEVLEVLGPSLRPYVRAYGTTINLSGGGMLLEVNRTLLPGAYHFRLHLPNEILQVGGNVIRNQKEASKIVPVEFLNLHEVERTKLIRFIFNRMRNIREDLDAKKQAASDDNNRHAQRLKKYFKPVRIRSAWIQ